MRSVLIIAHGSRAKETENGFDVIVEMVRQKLPELVIESAYMQLSDKTFEAAVTDLVARGATEVRIVPYFLFTGMHIRQDIPEMIDGFAKQFPGVGFSLGQPLGIDERLADVLVDRIKA